MATWLFLLFLFLIGQRIVELIIANRNEKWMKKQGAYEIGADHYKWFVVTHSMFLVFLLIESIYSPISLSFSDALLFIFLFVFLTTQLFRVWCIYSLGKFWNTKIIVLPGSNLVSRGPYRWIKHPNYLIVGIELFVIPLLFQAYLTALLFPILHLLLLRVRIPMEEKALFDVTISD
ncbi:hypothetical protein NC661_00055 [Aquibacillus koreensis]|uniref:Isoprenylcysteine carboxyl methyltransferase n=1 Tax=Aquibacillus koreensis TaxID=279446 RepID=A0A9X3WI14_9BACI|nr:isoprenylcysteine carboxylmethyltransferase family protein [Aquibacillus koreensis]MCT2537330.1 hypothetical protein [Aquibacillus koreensis]MDC3418776.1 hypothetical protein [Aquibacillus koreensis]